MNIEDVEDFKEFDEACTETDFTMFELVGQLQEFRKDKSNSKEDVARKMLEYFEIGVEGALEYIEDNRDYSCHLCGGSGGIPEPGMHCIACGGSGKERG